MTMQIDEVAHLVTVISPVLRGRKPAVQGAVLADLLAIWLAGHQVEGDPEATLKLRGDILGTHLLMVEELVAVNARLIGAVGK
jgi:hypothetical protein